MRIGLDFYSIDLPGENSGVGPGIYAYNLIQEMVRQSPLERFYIFTNRNNLRHLPQGNNVKYIINTLPVRYRFLRLLHEQILIPIWFLYFKVDFIHFFGNNISYILYSKSLLTVHDLVWKYYLERGYKSMKNYYFNFTVPISIKYAKGIITVSKFIAHEILKQKMRSSTCIPIYLAPGLLLTGKAESISPQIKEISCKKYIYSVTTSLPHKNLFTLLEAYNNLSKDFNFEYRLIITGQLKGETVFYVKRFIADNHLDQKVFLTGFVSEVDKNYLYTNSTMVIYPSFYEGFGLPILEAMLHNTPVITSNIASLPEIGGDACMYFNPYSVSDLQEKIKILLNDYALRDSLIQKGNERIKVFSWHKTAKETLKVYKSIFNL